MNVIVCDAIRARRLLRFVYDGYERIIEPHIHGINSQNHEMVSGWLVGGWSATRTDEGWRNYLIDEMHDVHALGERFPEPRVGYNAGDRNFRQVYCRLEAGAANSSASDAPAPRAGDEPARGPP